MKNLVLGLIAIILIVFMFQTPEELGEWAGQISNGYAETIEREK